MFDRERIRGVIPPLATPLTPDEKLDEQGLRTLIAKILDAGCHGILVLAGTGEGLYLSDQVRAQVIEVAVDEGAGRVPVIADISDVSVARAVSRGRQAEELGADVLISIPPFQRVMKPPEVYEYYLALAEETRMPTMLYNFGSTNISIGTIVRLAEHENIVGIKDAVDFSHVASVAIHTKGSGLRILVGWEFDFVPGMMMGCVGGTPAVGNVWPEIAIETYESCVAGDWERARDLQETLTRFTEDSLTFPWIAGCNYALSLLGVCGPTVMRPQSTLTEEDQARVRKWLTDFDLME